MREIYIDSRRRSEPFGNSYTLFIQNPLKNVTKAELVSATVPNTIYNITQGVNIFSVNETANCSISNGFYSSASLVNSLKAGLGDGVELSFICEEGKFIFHSANSFTVNVYSTEFSIITGFKNGLEISNLATFSNGVYSSSAYYGQNFVKSSNVANFKTCGEYIYLDIDELRRPHSIDAVNNVYNSQSSTIFAVVPLDVPSGCIKTFKENTDYKIAVEYPKQIDQIDRLTVRWLDYDGNVVNFNGVDENALILRFHEDKTTSSHVSKEFDDDVLEPMKFTKPDKRTVFAMLLFAIVFIMSLIKKRS
jgi:hypothetical protein